MKEADPDFVTRVMRDPRVWRWVCEDGIRPEQFSWTSSATFFQFEDKGFIMFRRITQRMAEFHIAMLEGARGFDVFIANCLAEMRSRGVRKFIAPIGEWNVAAIRLARRWGWKQEGRIEGAYMRNGMPRAMIFMGGV